MVQSLVSLCLVVLVVWQIDLSQVVSLALEPQHMAWLLAALLLFNLSKIVSAVRLNLYQRHAGILLNEWENLRLYYAGMFLNLFLPGGIGGDGYKVLVLHRRQAAPLRTLLWVTLVDRVSGVLILLVLVCVLLPFVDPPWHEDAVRMAAFVGGAAVALASVWLHHRLLRMHGARMAAVLVHGLAVQCLQLGCMATLLACLPVAAGDYPAFLCIFLLSSVAAALPLSIGGLGAREVVFLYGLQLLRLDPVHGVVASSGFFLVTAASSLLGAPLMGGFSTNAAVGAPAGCAREEG